ncbi:hypothetical protein LY76DRAFT_610402 [Colletotrichum caudatum]|nr:hypothetical protein LY76DRAFT_610402 [Colletotrichum caudatum]
MWLSPISSHLLYPSPPPPPPPPTTTIITVPFAVSVSGPVPTEKALVFPYARGVRQLLADVQRSSLADTTDIVVLHDQYAMLGAQIDSAWAETLSALLTRMRSELRDMEYLGFHTHPIVPMMQLRIQRFVEIVMSGQRIVQDAKRDLSDKPDQPDGPAAIMNNTTQNLCVWADIIDSGALPDDQALADVQRGAGNDASAICVILERNRDGRVKERLEVLDAFQSLLDDGIMSRLTLQEDLEAADWWFGFYWYALASLELKMSEVGGRLTMVDSSQKTVASQYKQSL